MGTLYFFMGVVFSYFAIESGGDTIWNISTIVLAIVATFDFRVSLRLFSLHIKIQNAKKK